MAGAQQGAALRDEALQRVEANANDRWKRLARNVITQLARSRPRFTTDEVWEEMRHWPDITTHERRAMGSVIRRAVKDGLIEGTDQYQLSSRPECHRNPKRVWRSLTYRRP